MGDKEQLYRYKGNRCCKCGMSVTEMIERYGTFHRMFDLHHIDPSKKSDNYNNLIRQNLSAHQLDEVDKCVLLCKICHGLVHAQNTQVEVTINVHYDERTVSQELSGWLIYDFRDRALTFLCEETLLLSPYIEDVNEAQHSVVFGVDLQSGEHFINKIRGLCDGDVYTIRSTPNGKLMCRCTKNENNVKVEQNVEFGFIKMDGGSAPKGSRFWYRNGLILYEDGRVQSEGLITFHLTPENLP